MSKDNHEISVTVGEIVALCEYVGCDVVDAIGKKIVLEESNFSDIYEFPVEHISAQGGTVKIWTLVNIDMLVEITKALKTYKKYMSDWDYSEEDHVYHGKLLGIDDLVSWESPDIEGIKAAYHEAVDDYIGICNQIKK